MHDAGFSYFSPMLRKAGFFLFLAVVCYGCANVSDDMTAPEFSELSLNATSFQPGENFQVSVSGRDDEELNQVRIRIRQAFSKNFGFWELVEVRDISGGSFSTNFIYLIPDSALAGLYEVSVQIADERGNGSPDSTLQFVINQPTEEPQISGFQTTPPIGEDGVLRLSPSDTLTFSGTVSDEDSLASFSIIFRDELGMDLTVVDYPVADTSMYNLESNPDTVFFESFQTFPTSMLIKTEDRPGHQKRLTFPVEVN